MAIGIPGGDRQVVVPTVVPTTDPTFTSGLNYARSIAGGENVPDMIAPGVSYSAARPQGYTQRDLPPIVSGLPNIVTDSPPDRPFSDANPPDYTNLPLNIIGGGRGDNISILDDIRFPPPQDFLRNYKPFDFGVSFILCINISSRIASLSSKPLIKGLSITSRSTIKELSISGPPISPLNESKIF